MDSPKFFIAHSIDKLPPGTVVDKWPLHMTLTPPFTIEPYNGSESIQTMSEVIAESGRNIGAIELRYGSLRSGSIPVEIGSRALYGDNEDIPVVKILDPSGKLLALHTDVIHNLAGIGCQFVNLKYALEDYSPHATTKSGSELDKPFMCDSLTINQKSDDIKTVVDHVDLCERN